MYEIFLERSAERDLKKLTTEAFQRIVLHLKALAGNPRPPGCRKIKGTLNDWRIRVGEYRIIYEIDENTKAVRIMKVRCRRESYR